MSQPQRFLVVKKDARTNELDPEVVVSLVPPEDNSIASKKYVDDNVNAVEIDDITPTTTKGDLLVEDGSNLVRLPVGTNGQVLSANSATTEGVEWTTLATSSVTIDTITPTTTKGDLLAEDGSNVVRLAAGLDGQYLTTNSATTTGLEWVTLDVDIDSITTTTTKGDLLVEDGSNLVRLPVGTNGQVLTANSGTTEGVEWATPASAPTIDDLTPTTTKGDLLVEDGSNVVRLAAGTDGQVLTANSATTEGVEWTTIATTGVTIDTITPTTTKGDILVEDGSNVVRLAAGTNGQVLAANSSTTTGLEWVAQSGGSGGGGTILTSSATIDVPTGSTFATVIATGGGGGGGAGGNGDNDNGFVPTQGGGGGGGGASFKVTQILPVVSEESLVITIGAGGAGGTIGVPFKGGDGGATTILGSTSGLLLSVTGGTGGANGGFGNSDPPSGGPRGGSGGQGGNGSCSGGGGGGGQGNTVAGTSGAPGTGFWFFGNSGVAAGNGGGGAPISSAFTAVAGSSGGNGPGGGGGGGVVNDTYGQGSLGNGGNGNTTAGGNGQDGQDGAPGCGGGGGGGGRGANTGAGTDGVGGTGGAGGDGYVHIWFN